MIRIWPRKGPEVQTGHKRALNTGSCSRNNSSSNNKNKRNGSNDNKSRRQSNKGGSLDSRYQHQQQQQQQQQHVLVPIASPHPKESTQRDTTSKGNLGPVYNIYSELWDFPQKTVF